MAHSRSALSLVIVGLLMGANGAIADRPAVECERLPHAASLKSLSDVPDDCRGEIEFVRRLADMAETSRGACKELLAVTPAVDQVEGFARQLLARTLYACGDQQAFLETLDALVEAQQYTRASVAARRVEELIQYQHLAEWLDDEAMYESSVNEALELVCSSPSLFDAVSVQLRDDERPAFGQQLVVGVLLWNWYRLEVDPQSPAQHACLQRALNSYLAYTNDLSTEEDKRTENEMWLDALRERLQDPGQPSEAR